MSSYEHFVFWWVQMKIEPNLLQHSTALDYRKTLDTHCIQDKGLKKTEKIFCSENQGEKTANKKSKTKNNTNKTKQTNKTMQKATADAPSAS